MNKNNGERKPEFLFYCFCLFFLCVFFMFAFFCVFFVCFFMFFLFFVFFFFVCFFIICFACVFIFCIFLFVFIHALGVISNDKRYNVNKNNKNGISLQRYITSHITPDVCVLKIKWCLFVPFFLPFVFFTFFYFLCYTEAFLGKGPHAPRPQHCKPYICKLALPLHMPHPPPPSAHTRSTLKRKWMEKNKIIR